MVKKKDIKPIILNRKEICYRKALLRFHFNILDVPICMNVPPSIRHQINININWTNTDIDIYIHIHTYTYIKSPISQIRISYSCIGLGFHVWLLPASVIFFTQNLSVVSGRVCESDTSLWTFFFLFLSKVLYTRCTQIYICAGLANHMAWNNAMLEVLTHFSLAFPALENTSDSEDKKNPLRGSWTMFPYTYINHLPHLSNE